VVFFQDTNAAVFRSLAAVVGSTALRNLEMNSVASPRRPGEAVGAICHLTKGQENLIINVEYNQV